MFFGPIRVFAIKLPANYKNKDWQSICYGAADELVQRRYFLVPNDGGAIRKLDFPVHSPPRQLPDNRNIGNSCFIRILQRKGVRN